MVAVQWLVHRTRFTRGGKSKEIEDFLYPANHAAICETPRHSRCIYCRYISGVNRTEIHYLTTRIATTDRADTVIEILEENGIRTVGCEETWREASYFKRKYAIALGDAFALATASRVSGTLVVGADDDFDAVSEVDIERFRTEPA